MRNFIITLLLALTALSATAQSSLTPGVAKTSPTTTNSYVVATGKTVWRSILVNNDSATDYYVHIYDSATNQLDNAKPAIAAFKVSAGLTSYFDSANGPILFNRGLLVVQSTTPTTLTNVSAGTSAFKVTAILNP